MKQGNLLVSEDAIVYGTDLTFTISDDTQEGGGVPSVHFSDAVHGSTLAVLKQQNPQIVLPPGRYGIRLNVILLKNQPEEEKAVEEPAPGGELADIQTTLAELKARMDSSSGKRVEEVVAVGKELAIEEQVSPFMLDPEGAGGPGEVEDTDEVPETTGE